MVDKRISQLPLATGGSAPVSSDFFPIDGAATRKVSLAAAADAIRPMASQAEAEAGLDSVKGMSALTVSQAITAKAATVDQGVKADNALPRAGGTMTGTLTGDDGGIHRSSKWLFNDVRDAGADITGSANASASFSAAKLVSTNVRVPKGTYKLDDFYSLNLSGVYHFDHDANITKPDGTLGTAAINSIQIGTFLQDRNRNQRRSGGMISTPSGRFKADNTLYAGADAFETVMDADVLWYNRSVAGSVNGGYTVGAFVSSTDIIYGFGTPATGTVALQGGRINVMGMAQPDSGRNEMTPLAYGVIAIDGHDQYAMNAYIDSVISGPKTQQPGFLSGYSSAVKNRNAGGLLDADHDGSYGYVGFTSPYIGGFNSPIDTNWPLRAMYHAHGWSRNPALSAANGRTDGHATDANFGADAAYLAGGPGGGVWSESTDRAKFNKAFQAYDYFTGLHLSQPHPHSTDPRAIHIWRDGGKSIFGLDANGSDVGPWTASNAMIHVGTGGTGLGDSVRTYASTAGTNKRTTINMNGDYVLMTDTSANGGRTFGAFSAATSSFPFLITQAGAILMSLQPAARVIPTGGDVTLTKDVPTGVMPVGGAFQLNRAGFTAGATFNGRPSLVVPQTGVYQVTFKAFLKAGTTDRRLCLQVNGTSDFCQLKPRPTSEVGGSEISSAQAVLTLQANDYLTMVARVNNVDLFLGYDCTEVSVNFLG